MSDSARTVAVEAVRRVTDGEAFSNLLLPSLLDRAGLSARDRALATELTYGTLRRLVPIDRALSSLVRRPLDRATAPARAALRLGAYQLLHTRIPAHAAVTETVSLVPPRQRAFVNAVLRRLAAEPPEPPRGPDDEEVAGRTGLAPWAVGELRRLLGDEAEEAAAALASPGPLPLRTNTCRTTPERLARRLADAGLDPQAGTLHPGMLHLGGGRPSDLPGFADGWFAVQDEASAWVVDVLGPERGDRVLDACAAPGGKATDIACRAGAVIAADVSPRRLGLVRRTADRLGVTARIVAQDTARPALREGFDRILVDAPCTGIGAARRRPELLWRPRRTDLSRLARLQVRIALGAASLLAPGGILVYSVCTFPRAETDAACDALLDRAPDLRPDPFAGPDGTSTTRARLWPHRHGTDAMFVARFRRSD
ncbi:MAG TPA: 16S rRNA (cytosine(967)-C(5))-methyltransferase RsmB [Actinomycetota bacterium]|nr:16S rRNA (cytosine(967)-C(5))-methyltransferase RsmB [Actinomycetota bacterium]